MEPRRLWTFDELPKAARDEFPRGEHLVFVEVDAGMDADPPRAFVPADVVDGWHHESW